MKTDDLFLGALAFGVVVVAGLMWRSTAQAAQARNAQPATPNNVSYFSPEAQREWAVPDQQLNENFGWANL
jgi:hypothetical protein